MKKLSKNQASDRDDFVAKLTLASVVISKVWEAFIKAHEALANKIAEYNETLSEISEWRDQMMWEAADFDPIDVPDLPEPPEPEHSDTIDGLPEQPDS